MATDSSQTRADAKNSEPLRSTLRDLVRKKGYEHRSEPFALSSGRTSQDYVDMRRAVANGDDLHLAATALLSFCAELHIDFDAIGGMTMGADPVAHACAVLGHRSWFSVRKAEKSHGAKRRIEGAILDEHTNVVLFEDTVTTGGSILEALDVVQSSSARVVAAITLLDRGESAARAFQLRKIDYHALLTYEDLGIAAIDAS